MGIKLWEPRQGIPARQDPNHMTINDFTLVDNIMRQQHEMIAGLEADNRSLSERLDALNKTKDIGLALCEEVENTQRLWENRKFRELVRQFRESF